MGKSGIILLFAVLMTAMMANVWAAGSCSDGTEYFKCSKTTPGLACLSSAGDLKLVNVLGLPAERFQACKCSNFEGWVKQGDKCVKTTCDYNGNTIKNGACVEGTKPKRCVDGGLVNNAKVCGCPDGQQADESGIECMTRIGCRWGTKPCSPREDCKFEESIQYDDGKCEPKIGCAYGTKTCASTEECDSSTNPDGLCVKKQGCQYNNPRCGTGQKCNKITGLCFDSDEDTSGTVGKLEVTSDDDVDTDTANALTDEESGALCCPCMPAAGMVLLVTYIASRKKK